MGTVPTLTGDNIRESTDSPITAISHCIPNRLCINCLHWNDMAARVTTVAAYSRAF